jgi:hypothetical protein
MINDLMNRGNQVEGSRVKKIRDKSVILKSLIKNEGNILDTEDDPKDYLNNKVRDIVLKTSRQGKVGTLFNGK